MSYLSRWEPFREMTRFRDMMDWFLREPFDHPIELREGLYDSPMIDMFETDAEVVVKAALPGVGADEVSISIRGDTLTISGEVKEETEVEEADYRIRERRMGKFMRTLQLPSAVDADKAEATFKDGILSLQLPKAEGVKPKIIAVKSE